MNDAQREKGKKIHRATGKTFYYATRLLPERVRDQTYVLYGFFRIADEIVDSGHEKEAATQRRELESLRAAALGHEQTEDPVVEAFAELVETEGISDEEVDAFIDAMLSDIETERYETFEELREYMRGSAAAVGNMMTTIMDVEEAEKARPHAMALGEAFQLTNFIRDVREDIDELGRVYLPLSTFRRQNVTVDQLEGGEVTPGFRRAIRTELHRAEQQYRTGVQGIEHLPEDCQFPVLLAAVLYAEHHRLFRNQEFDVLSTRPSLSRRRKLWVVVKTWYHWRRLGDPVAVFRRVGAVPADEGASEVPYEDSERIFPTD